MRVQMMAQQHGLRPLQVGVARKIGAGVALAQVDEGVDQVEASSAATSVTASRVKSRRSWRPGRCGCARCGASRRRHPRAR